MRRPPIRIRTFLLGTVLVLFVVPTAVAGSAWLIEREHQQADIHRRLNAAAAYLTAHRTEMQHDAAVRGFARELDRLDLLAILTLVTDEPPAKDQLYVSPPLDPARQKQELGRRIKEADRAGASSATDPAALTTRWTDDGQRLIPVTTSGPKANLSVDLYYRPASGSTRWLVAVVSGVLVLLAGLAVAAWLAGRWMVAPLTRLSAQVDKVAGGDLTVSVPRSRIGEVDNIAQAVEGMTAALGETAQRRAEADEARRFLVTSVAHDLRTPLFALRGHLQAIGSRLGNPGVHLDRAEARADALERLIGNLFAYTRDEYAHAALQLEEVPVATLLEEVTGDLEHAARLRDNAFELIGDRAIRVVVDRDRTRRALANVLDNALRYSPAGAPVRLSWAADDGSAVELTVRDHGPGIDPEVLPHVFEPGIRGAPAANGLDGGAGLGLTIARRFLEHQHATLTARNDGGGGAVMTLVLRRAPSRG